MSRQNAIETDIDIAAPAWETSGLDIAPITRKTAHYVIETVLADRTATVELSIVLTDDRHIQELNRTYRGQDKPTNVLSFPQQDDGFPCHFADDDSPMIVLGDVIIAYETLAREATEQNKALTDHYTHILVHGILHLCGYDHENDEDAAVMEQLEINILAEMGIANPYFVS